MNGDKRGVARPPSMDRQGAVGYVRAEQPDEGQISAWRREIAAFCAVEGYRLAAVYCDRGDDGLESARPAFTGLLDALAVPTNVAVVLADAEHLSPDNVVRMTLLRLIRRAGATVLAIDEASGDRKTTGRPEGGGVSVDAQDDGEPS